MPDFATRRAMTRGLLWARGSPEQIARRLTARAGGAGAAGGGSWDGGDWRRRVRLR